jgi:uncharacterized membrane protein HdeD (DUF308 family)
LRSHLHELSSSYFALPQTSTAIESLRSIRPSDGPDVLQKGLEVVIYCIVIVLTAANILETVWLRLSHIDHAARTWRIAASVIGMIAGFIGAQHGYFEILERDAVLDGALFDAISGRSFSNLPTSQWTGWPAMTLVRSFLVTGVLAILVSLVVMAWSAMFVQRKDGGRTLILLSILLLLVGGGFIPPLFGVLAGVIGTYGNRRQGLRVDQLSIRTQ